MKYRMYTGKSVLILSSVTFLFICGLFLQNSRIAPSYIQTRSLNQIKKLDSEMRPRFTFSLAPVKGNTRCQRICLNTKAKPEVLRHMYFFVKSANKNIFKRNTIRRTWASLSIFEGYLSRTIFVTGRSQSARKSRDSDLNKENHVHGDILQANIPDDYANIPLKTLASMQWASENLNPEDIYSSVDDDILINLIELLESIKFSFARMAEHGWGEFPIICGFVKGVGEKPVRDFDGIYGKYAITKADYKWHVFPDYCHGGLYTTSVSIVRQLYEVSRHCDILRLDDVWLTGIIREMIGMPADLVLNKPNNYKSHYVDIENSMISDNIKGLRKGRPFVEVWGDMFKNITQSSKEYCICG